MHAHINAHRVQASHKKQFIGEEIHGDVAVGPWSAPWPHSSPALFAARLSVDVHQELGLVFSAPSAVSGLFFQCPGVRVVWGSPGQIGLGSVQEGPS